MKKWYTILTVLTLSIALVACSGEDTTEETESVEETAPAQEAVETEAGEAATAEESHGHSHGADGHSHEPAAKVEDDAVENELGALLATLDGSKEIEIACGTCIYGMEGEGCPIAATVGNESYFITGVEFETHGLGLCKAAAKGKVTGDVYEKGIVATKIELTD